MRRCVSLIVSVTVLAMLAGAGCAEKGVNDGGKHPQRLVVLIYGDGEYTETVDVTGWEPGEEFLKFYDPETPLYLHYPWSGEDTIRYFSRPGYLYVDSVLVGIDMRFLGHDSTVRAILDTTDLSHITTLFLGYGVDEELFSQLPGLKVVHFKSDKTVLFLLDDSECSYTSPPAPSTFIDVIPSDVAVYVQDWGGDLKPLQGLNNIRGLDIIDCEIKAHQLRFLRGMRNLRSLRVECVAVPNAGLQYLKNHPNLRELSIYNSNVGDRGARCIATIDGLESLSAADVRFSDTGLRHIGKLKNLKRLYLSPPQPITLRQVIDGVKDDKLWWYLQSHRELHELMQNLATVFAPTPSGAGWMRLARMDNLGSLKLGNYYLDAGAVEMMGDLESLRYLSFYMIELTPRASCHLQGFSNLRTLKCNRANIDDEWLHFLAQNSEIKNLNLLNTNVTRKGLVYLPQMTHLKNLTLTWVWPEDEGYAPKVYFDEEMWKVISRIENLERLSVERTDIENHALHHLRRLNKLRGLNFEWNNLNGEGLKNLARIPNLEELSLWDTEVTNGDLRYLSSFPRLQRLRIWELDFDDQGIGHLKKLKGLKVICGQFRPEHKQELEKALPRCEVDP